MLAVLTAIVVTLVTCLQVLYLESLRIRARELPALQFFKETLEAKIGIETERGSLAFSLVKHIGLAHHRMPGDGCRDGGAEQSGRVRAHRVPA